MLIGSLFSGIGGLELGLEWAGLGPVIWQVERDDYCSRVLARHWPSAQRFDDVCTVGGHNLRPVDLICGGFPCQDLSFAGQGAGLDGSRSGLWREFVRILGELRPRVALVENVPALLSRGLGRVLGDLSALGFDAFWDCVPAAAVRAPHQRDRLFVVAYRDCVWQPQSQGSLAGERGWTGNGSTALANSATQREREPADQAVSFAASRRAWDESGLRGQLADSHCERPHRTGQARTGRDEPSDGGGGFPQSGVGRVSDGLSSWMDRGWPSGPGEPQKEWEAPRVAQGIKDRVARLRGLGNAVCPQVAYVIGCAIRSHFVE